MIFIRGLYLCSMKENNQAIIYASLTVLSWSTVATAFKVALMHLTHFEMLLVASCTALLVFILVLTFQRKWSRVCNLTLRQWGYFACMGFLNPVGYYLILFKAYDLLPAQIAQPINYAWPIVLLFFFAVFDHQPIPRRKYIGMCFSLGGVILITLGGDSGGKNISFIGIILAALSACLWALYWWINNRKRDIDASVNLFMTFFFGTIYLVIGACIVGAHIYTFSGIFSGIYIGCFEIAVPFVFFGLAMRKTTNHALINQMCYVSPFLSLFLISIVLGEQIALTTYLGLTFIVGGIIYNQYSDSYWKSRRIRE